MTEPASPPASGGTPPVPGTTTPQSGLTPEEVRGRAAWVKAGLSPEVFDKRMSGETPAPGSKRGPDGKFAAPTVGDGTNLDVPRVARARDMVAKLQAQGVDQARIDAALKADGIDLSSAPQLTPQQIEHNKDFAQDRLYAPGDYAINFRNVFGSAVEGMDPADLKAVHAEMGGAMSAMNLSPALGASLAERSLQVAAQVKAMTPAELQVREGANKATLQRKWGADYQARMSEAAAALRMIPDKELAASIARLSDPWIIQTLSSHGRNLLRWQSAYPKGTKQ